MNLYLLENLISGKYFIGITKNLKERLVNHNSSNSHYTGKQQGEWKMISSKYFEKEIEARQEELRLKRSKNRKYIKWYFMSKGTGL